MVGNGACGKAVGGLNKEAPENEPQPERENGWWLDGEMMLGKIVLLDRAKAELDKASKQTNEIYSESNDSMDQKRRSLLCLTQVISNDVQKRQKIVICRKIQMMNSEDC